MRKAETRVIGEYKYSVMQMGALEGRQLLLKITKALAGAAAGDIFASLKEEDFEMALNKFAKLSTVSGGEYGEKQPQLDSVFDMHFAGKYGDMLEWAKFAFEVNFGSFLGALGKLADSAKSE